VFIIVVGFSYSTQPVAPSNAAWLQTIFAALELECTYIVKTNVNHEEPLMVHVDSIPAGVERLGSQRSRSPSP
jgi:hypothetical protein